MVKYKINVYQVHVKFDGECSLFQLNTFYWT